MSRASSARREKLLEYVTWLRQRVAELGGEDYRPVLHIDVYGTLGLAFQDDLEKISVYLTGLEKAAAPLKLRLEGPVDSGSKEGQIEALARLRRMRSDRGSKVEIVADDGAIPSRMCAILSMAARMIR